MIEFAAVLAYTGQPTRGGWVLAALGDVYDGVPVVRELPLPLFGQPGTGHGRIGFLEHLRYMREAVVGRGFIDSNDRGRDYAGSLRLGLTRIAMEGETWRYTEPAEGEKGPVHCEEWRVSGASIQTAPAWDLPKAEVHIRGMM